MDPELLDAIQTMTPEQKAAFLEELKQVMFSMADYTEGGPVEAIPPANVNPGPLLPTGDAGIQRNGGFMGPPSPLPPAAPGRVVGLGGIGGLYG